MSSTRRTWIEIVNAQHLLARHKLSSTRRTWIEMYTGLVPVISGAGCPPHGGRGLKLCHSAAPPFCIMSSSTRRTWIEIFLLSKNDICSTSSSTRRTWIEIAGRWSGHFSGRLSSSTRRTWIEIGCRFWYRHKCGWSSSTRRTWIEICHTSWRPSSRAVVLHTEDVD